MPSEQRYTVEGRNTNPIYYKLVPRLERGNPQDLLPLWTTGIFFHQWRSVFSLKSAGVGEPQRVSACVSVKVDEGRTSVIVTRQQRWPSVDEENSCCESNSFIKQRHNISDNVPQLVLDHGKCKQSTMAATAGKTR